MFNYNLILTDLIFILLQFFLIPVAYKFLNKNIFQPAVLFALVWFSIILLHFLMKFTVLDELESLSIKTYVTFLLGTIFFVVGSFFTNQSLTNVYNSKPVIHEGVNINIRIIFFLIALIGLPFYIRAAFQIFLVSQSENFFMGLRNELSNNEADIGVVKYLMPLSYVVYAFNLVAFYKNKNSINKIILYVSFLVITIYSVFATGRTFFFIILSIYLGISALFNKRFSFKKIGIIITVFLFLFMIVGIIYGKGGDLESSTKDNSKSAIQNLGIYLVTSLNALDVENNNHSESQFNGDNTLRPFIKLGMYLGLIGPRKILEVKQDFVFVPYATNVYTYYSPYIRDFGRIYAWLMLSLYGALHTFLFYKSFIKKSTRASIYYSFMLFPLLLSFFGDQYITVFSLWIQLIFFTELGFGATYIIDKIKIMKTVKMDNQTLTN